MPQDLLHRLPSEVTIDLDEIRALVAGLERIQESLSDMEATDLEIAVDNQILSCGRRVGAVD